MSSETDYHLIPELTSSVLREEHVENGYICHTTGSGKTLSSFKAATLLKKNEHMNNPAYPMELFLRVAKVSVETVRIVNGLLGLEIKKAVP